MSESGFFSVSKMAVVLIAISASPVFAAGGAGCIPGGAPAEAVQSFKSNPGAVIDGMSDAGADLAMRVRNLVGADGSNLDALLKLAGTTPADQKSAIGSGLGQLADLCVRSREPENYDRARAIQQAVLAMKDDALYSAFVASISGFETNAILGFAAVGGAVGGPVNVSQISSRSSYGTSTPYDRTNNAVGSYSFGHGGGSVVEIVRNVSASR